MIDDVALDACIRKLVALNVPKVPYMQPRPGPHPKPAQAFISAPPCQASPGIHQHHPPGVLVGSETTVLQ